MSPARALRLGVDTSIEDGDTRARLTRIVRNESGIMEGGVTNAATRVRCIPTARPYRFTCAKVGMLRAGRFASLSRHHRRGM